MDNSKDYYNKLLNEGFSPALIISNRNFQKILLSEFNI